MPSTKITEPSIGDTIAGNNGSSAPEGLIRYFGCALLFIYLPIKARILPVISGKGNTILPSNSLSWINAPKRAKVLLSISLKCLV